MGKIKFRTKRAQAKYLRMAANILNKDFLFVEGPAVKVLRKVARFLEHGGSLR